MPRSDTERRDFLKKISAGAGGSVILAGCTESVNDPGTDTKTTTEDTDAQTTVKIGSPTALTGPYGQIGQWMVNGFKIGLERANNAGLLDGFSIDYSVTDVGLDTNKAITEARKMVNEEGADLIAGVMSSNINLAMMPEIKKLDVPFVINLVGSNLITGKECNSHTFRVNNNAHQETMAGMKYWLNQDGIDNIFFVGSDFGWPQSILKTTKQQIRADGRNPEEVIVGEEFVPIQQQDYSKSISNIGDSDADLVWFGMAGTNAIQFLTQARDLGLMAEKEFSGPGFGDVDVLQPLGKEALGVKLITRWSYTVDTSHSKDFVQRYLDKHNEPPHMYAGAGHKGAWDIANILNEVGSPDTDEILSSWPGFEWEGIAGPDRMRACDHQSINPVYLAEFVAEEDYDGPFEGEAKSGVYPEIFDTVAGREVARPCEETGCNL